MYAKTKTQGASWGGRKGRKMARIDTTR